jgi:hypothetical protein
LGRPHDNDSASECAAKAKADPDFRIPRRLGSPTKRRVFGIALTEMLLVDMDCERIESWYKRATLQDDKGKENGDDDGEEEEDDDDSTQGAAQGVSSNPTGAISSPSERINVEPETPKGLTNPDLRNALHPVFTGSALHRTGAAADKDEFPWLHEYGIPVDNDATVYGLVYNVQKHSGLR